MNYYRPIFSTIIILAEYVYCIRDPYVSVVYAAGKFKETAKSAYIEAGINILFSVGLISKYGLVGIAIATFAGMLYRMLYLVYYIHKKIIHRPMWKATKRLFISAMAMFVSCICVKILDRTGSTTFLLWIKNGVISVFTFGFVTLMMNLLFDKKSTFIMISYMKKGKT